MNYVLSYLKPNSLIDEAVDFPAPLPKEELMTNVNKKKIHEVGAS